MGRLDGKVAIVTGAAMGQGAEEALLFAKEGAKVVATDVQETKLHEVVNHITDIYGDVALAVRHDVSSEEDWTRVVSAAADRFGAVHILINNAGISINASLDSITFEQWANVMNINAWSQFIGMRAVLPEMKKAGGGSIVNIASIVSLVGMGLNPYTASKGAIRAMSKAAAMEFAPFHIRVNSVYPGIIETPMTDELLRQKQWREAFEQSTPLPRLGVPKDVATGVLYLASDESSFVTGTELVIDGGLVAR